MREACGRNDGKKRGGDRGYVLEMREMGEIGERGKSIRENMWEGGYTCVGMKCVNTGNMFFFLPHTRQKITRGFSPHPSFYMKK